MRSGVPEFVMFLGVLAAGLAGGWWYTSGPDDDEARVQSIRCTLDGVDCVDFGRTTTGPIVLAIVGGVLFLAGAILFAGESARQRQ